jgi:sulfide:quinone oxidoreductase
MLTAQEASGMREGVRVVVATPERTPLSAFGVAASKAVADVLREHDVELVTGFSGELASLGVERVIALPRLEGRAVAGIPHDSEGFVEIDAHCAVLDAPGVYAAGDGVAFPVKLGGLAAEMADALAEHIAARAGADVEPQPFVPVLRGKLLTGAAPRSIRGGERESDAADHILWWPPAKVAARHLAPAVAGEPGEVLLDVEPGPDALSVRLSLDARLGRVAG